MNIEKPPVNVNEYAVNNGKKVLKIESELKIAFLTHAIEWGQIDEMNLAEIINNNSELLDMYDDNPKGVLDDIFDSLKKMRTEH